ncbi:MAG TPA: Rpp14/Pop5 family protein [Methanocorpusculum sp.]|nr:Rpp14/Pop5 family protein [Candidatus Methanocorpusculum faecipullorum]HJK07526.1 Rpp14/Pop5 family protein [Methanocorpusculum sp.]HJK08294.1 Rpp14/Pop5 family protein [Methanocorpusculum sp.]HJK10602.1 Rpp14/Pop5 family protein [Methanocorpusculum sp.]HJK13321.1 Rpp14/Pop5 family protein [Methanocorpusculum sp.]
MRPLPPTLRENRRYLLVKITGEFAEMPQQVEIYHAIRDAASELFGDAGSAQMHIAVVWSENEHAIIRCSRGWEQQTIACAAVITRLCGVPAVFRTVAVSGTVHGAKNHIKNTTWDRNSLAGYQCSGKKIDSLKGSNTQEYLTRDDILKE